MANSRHGTLLHCFSHDLVDDFKMMAMSCFVHHMMEIYTDGSMVPTNDGRHCGGLSVYFGKGDSRNVSESMVFKEVNHNTMEIMAILRALELTMEEKDVTIFTDSQFVLTSLNETYKKRQQNDWKNGNGVHYAHYETVSQCRGLIDKRASMGFKTKISYVAAHTGHKSNNAADKLAYQASHKFIND